MINEQYIARHGLKECLYAFRGAEDGSIDAKMSALKTEFYHLAQKMLYGGFLQVGDDYEIYIRTVEFYYHEEKESENRSKTLSFIIVTGDSPAGTCHHSR